VSLRGSTTFLRPARGIEGWRRSEPVARGSGNVFRDLGCQNADIEQLKAILAAEIIRELDREDLSVRGAQGRTGIAATDFSRVRNADLGRFTVDRLMSILNRLGSRVEVTVTVTSFPRGSFSPCTKTDNL
jgi:predicted XRE-type DNA-binding protein